MVAEAAALPAGTLVGRYRLLRKLSAGGFGTVYAALDDRGRRVAIKEYLPQGLVRRAAGTQASEVPLASVPAYHIGLQSFFEEGRVLAQISHPAVVGVRDFFRANETVYLAMDYLHGATLQDFAVIARRHYGVHGLGEATLVSVFSQILSGLHVVHQNKLLHLDLKPANIMITNDNQAVMLDFGAARQALVDDGGWTRPMYTRGFAAPEFYERGAALGVWTDFYALGACLYSCMTGTPPPDARQRSPTDALSAHLAALRAHYPGYLIDLIAAAMTLDAQQRPPSAQALRKMLICA